MRKGSPILTIFSNGCTTAQGAGRTEYNVISVIRISSSAFILQITCVISSQSSLLNPLDHPHWSLSSNHQLTPVSTSQTTPSSIPHLTCVTNFLLLLMFLISSILHHHPALLHRHTLIMDRLLTFLVAFSTLVLKLSFVEVFLSISFYPFLRLISWNYDHSLAVNGGGSIGKCGRLSQHSWLLVRTI